MTELTVVTVDDEPLALRRLALAIARIPGFKVIGEADGCAAGLRRIAECRPDILIVDIKMRDGTGFDLLAGLPPGDMPAVIFATAFDSFAVRAFETPAVDYVLKPIELPRLRDALDRAKARIASDTAAARAAEMESVIANLRTAMTGAAPVPDEREIWVRGRAGTLTRVALSDVILVTSEDDYVRLHLAEQSHLVRSSIRAFERELPPGTFVRVHRSALVRQSAITEVVRSPLGVRVVLANGQTIDAGRVHARALLAAMKRERLD